MDGLINILLYYLHEYYEYCVRYKYYIASIVLYIYNLLDYINLTVSTENAHVMFQSLTTRGPQTTYYVYQQK